MKKIVFFTLVGIYSQFGAGQITPDQMDMYEMNKYIDEKEREKRNLLIEKCNCPEQVINTDSVYSFLKSGTFGFRKGNIMWEVEDEPISYDSLINIVEKYRMLKPLEWYYTEKDTTINKMEEFIPPATFRKMLSVMFDPTTQLSSPIVKWNAARLGEEWITKSNNLYLNILLNKRMKKRNEKAYYKFLSLFSSANSFLGIKMSVPVFDDEYKYAFMILDMGKGYCYALFHRKETQWEPVFVSEGGWSQYSRYDNFNPYIIKY